MKGMIKARGKIAGWGGIAALLSLVFLAGAATVFAQGTNLTNPLGSNCNDLNCPLQKIIQLFWIIATPLSAIMVLVGGFQMMTSAGDPEKFSSGKKTLLYAAIGFAVLLVSGSVAVVIQNLFGQ